MTLKPLYPFGAAAARLSSVSPPHPSPPSVNPGCSQLVTQWGPLGTKPKEETKPHLLPAHRET